MATIAENYQTITKKVIAAAHRCDRNPDDITLIAVSKKKDVPTLLQGIDAGARHLGENYIQEAVQKIEIIGRDTVTWHFIGHLQSNKAKIAVQYFDYIHTVDSFKLASVISRQAEKFGKTQNILVQVNIGEEASKSGVHMHETVDLIGSVKDLAHIHLAGLMGMPPYFSDPEEARPYFRQMALLKDRIQDTFGSDVNCSHLSMGMSNDFGVAIEEGASMVRVGTQIFGERL